MSKLVILDEYDANFDHIIDDDYFFESMGDHMIKLTSQMDGGNGLKETSTYEIVRKLNI